MALSRSSAKGKEILRIADEVGEFKPLYKLSRAIIQFEKTLSASKQSEFQQLSKTKARVNDVAELMSDINQVLRRNAKQKSSIGAKLRTLATAVQKFVALGDILVPLSGSPTVRGVWFAFRMALLSVASIETTLESLSSLFMAVGRTAPIYDDLAALYRQSPRFQDALCEYHIIVVNLCKTLMEHSQSVMKRMTLPFKTKDLKQFEDDLNDRGLIIQHEKELLLAVDVRSIASDMKDLQVSIHNRDNLSKEEKKAFMMQRVLDTLPGHEYTMSYQQQRKMGNTEFYQDDSLFKEWIEGRKPWDLWALSISGKLGSGKTVLMANLIETLESIGVKKPKWKTAYFFCRHDKPESLLASNIMGCLTKQLLLAVSEQIDWPSLEKNGPPGYVKEFVNLILMAKTHIERINIVLDGLYECTHEEHENIMPALKTLQAAGVHICLTQRNHPDRNYQVSKHIKIETIKMPPNNQDIERYLETELTKRYDDGRLKLGNSELILQEICETLMEGANDMFLWVALMIDCLCLENSDYAIRAALKRLPKDLPELFQRILEKSTVPGLSTVDQDRIFRLIIGGRRLLNTDEIAEALSIQPFEKTWDPLRKINDILAALACCGSLIVIDEEDKTVRFIHQTVQEFLSQQRTCLQDQIIQKSMADILITYLSLDIVGTTSTRKVPIVSQLKEVPLANRQDIIGAVGYSMVKPARGRELALRILKSKKNTTKEISTQTYMTYEIQVQPLHHLLDYAKQHLMDHAIIILDHLETESAKAFSRLLEHRKQLFTDYLTTSDVRMGSLWWSNSGQASLLIALTLEAEDTYPIVRHILSREDSMLRTPIECFANLDRVRLVQSIMWKWAICGWGPVPGLVKAFEVQLILKHNIAMVNVMLEHNDPWFSVEPVQERVTKSVSYRDKSCDSLLLDASKLRRRNLLVWRAALVLDLVDVLQALTTASGYNVMFRICEADGSVTTITPLDYALVLCGDRLSLDEPSFESKCLYWLSRNDNRTGLVNVKSFARISARRCRQQGLIGAIYLADRALDASSYKRLLSSCQLDPPLFFREWKHIERLLERLGIDPATLSDVRSIASLRPAWEQVEYDVQQAGDPFR